MPYFEAFLAATNAASFNVLAARIRIAAATSSFALVLVFATVRIFRILFEAFHTLAFLASLALSLADHVLSTAAVVLTRIFF